MILSIICARCKIFNVLLSEADWRANKRINYAIIYTIGHIESSYDILSNRLFDFLPKHLGIEHVKVSVSV